MNIGTKEDQSSGVLLPDSTEGANNSPFRPSGSNEIDSPKVL
jgi:hypothetical protein